MAKSVFPVSHDMAACMKRSPPNHLSTSAKAVLKYWTKNVPSLRLEVVRWGRRLSSSLKSSSLSPIQMLANACINTYGTASRIMNLPALDAAALPVRNAISFASFLPVSVLENIPAFDMSRRLRSTLAWYLKLTSVHE